MSNTLTRLEGVNNFTEFVKAFSQFGSEMVDFALVTGDRQNDLKDERRRAQMSAARTILERSTLMLLTASKVSSLISIFMVTLIEYQITRSSIQDVQSRSCWVYELGSNDVKI